MKLAVLTLAYREQEFIKAVIENWKGKVHKHLILESSKPWHGQELPEDKTREICKGYEHVELVSLAWPSETTQRNWGLGRLYEYDYVIIVDADELYTEDDQLSILPQLGKVEKYQDNTWCYRIVDVVTYFKTPEYVLEPRDTHQPVFALNPKKVTFIENRAVDTQWIIPLPGTMHHITYLRNDLRLFHKLQQFEHYDQVKQDWFMETWRKWVPDMEDIRAYGGEKSKAVKNPMPEELLKLLNMV